MGFVNMIADMEANKTLGPMITKLLMRWRKMNI